LFPKALESRRPFPARHRRSLRLVKRLCNALTPATPQDLANALSFALRFDGRKRFRVSSEYMAGIIAKHVLEYLATPGCPVLSNSDQRRRLLKCIGLCDALESRLRSRAVNRARKRRVSPEGERE
jgi:hypothetical protein